MRRLYLPAYSVADAARFSGVHPNTVAYWHLGPTAARRLPGRSATRATLPGKEKRKPLSYLQLIEVAVVATFRKMGVELKVIRDAHDYCAQHLNEEFPFARYTFATDGVELILHLADLIPRGDVDKIIVANRSGQFGWKEIVGERFNEFEYEHDLAVRWNVGGDALPLVVINPKVSFGAPNVAGIPTWVLRGRWEAGESIEDIADDFGLAPDRVVQGLSFEGVRVAPTAA